MLNYNNVGIIFLLYSEPLRSDIVLYFVSNSVITKTEPVGNWTQHLQTLPQTCSPSSVPVLANDITINPVTQSRTCIFLIAFLTSLSQEISGRYFYDLSMNWICHVPPSPCPSLSMTCWVVSTSFLIGPLPLLLCKSFFICNKRNLLYNLQIRSYYLHA